MAIADADPDGQATGRSLCLATGLGPVAEPIVDLLLTIEMQRGHRRSLAQVSRPVRVGQGQLRALRLLHFAVALGW
jgi:hypothetical protein